MTMTSCADSKCLMQKVICKREFPVSPQPMDLKFGSKDMAHTAGNTKGDLRKGRLAAALFLVQLVGLIAPYVILMPLVKSDYLTQAATQPGMFKVAVAWLVLNNLVALVLSLTLASHIKNVSALAAKALVAASAVLVLIQVWDAVQLFRMLSLSTDALTSGVNAGIEQAAMDLRAARRVVHSSWIVSIDVWYVLFYGSIVKFRVLPAFVGWIGLLTTALHLTGLTIPFLMGSDGNAALGASLVISQVLASGWLIAKGFSPSSGQA